MGWMQRLCEVYDAGIASDQSREAAPLVPLGFIQKKVKYHVVLTGEGQFVSADELANEAQLMEIPSTPQAEGRTGDNGTPFPLVEQLKYLVYEDKNRKRFEQYMEQLNAWCERPDAPDCLRAVRTYLNGHTLLSDLSAQPNMKLKYDKGEDGKAMVCFSVQMEDGSNDDLWLRADIRQSWSGFLADNLPGRKAFCYVEGKELPLIDNHAKVQGNAKLISAKDAEFPFQYKGRFADDRSAAQVSYDASARAHNALAWLVARQGVQRHGMTWLVWNTNGAAMNVPLDENNGFFEEEEEDEGVAGPPIDTFESYAKQVGSAARGYGGRLHDYDPARTNCVVILGLEAATDGRMSVTYYQECPGNEYVERLEAWYRDCCWWRYCRRGKPKEIGTPDPEEIAIAVMGVDAVKTANRDKKCEKSHTKLMRQLRARLLTCIVDRQPMPLDLMRSAFYRACAPLSFVAGKEGKWSRSAWENSVDAACAMIACFQKRRQGDAALEVFLPELQTRSRNPDYLYGRLLAVADRAEQQAAVERGQDYPTNAIRLMQRFAQRPFETWPMIHEKLTLSFGQLGPDSWRYQRLIGEIEQLFLEGDRYERGALSYEFLQGFSSQRQSFYQTWEAPPKEGARYQLPHRRAELYGCLLAIADVAEQRGSDGARVGVTNAMQMMPVFAARPYESWGRLHGRLIPYLEKLGEQANYYQWLMGLVEGQFVPAERELAVPLDGSYLHGYYGMLQTFYQKTEFSWAPQPPAEAQDKRSALYGRLLGIAERLERRCFLGKEELDQRPTNELRLMAAFAQKPAATWESLKIKLAPYQRYAGRRAAGDSALLEQLEDQLRQNGWNTNAPLNSIYLHHYYQERKNDKVKEN